MEFLGFSAKIIFGIGLVFVAVYGVLGVVILWRYSLSKTFALALSLSFLVLALIIISHAFYIFTSI